MKIPDGKLTLEIKDGKTYVDTGGGISMASLACMCGALQVVVALEAHRRGRNIDEVKDFMYDLYADATWDAERSIKKMEAGDSYE